MNCNKTQTCLYIVLVVCDDCNKTQTCLYIVLVVCDDCNKTRTCLCIVLVVCDDCNTEYEGDCPVHGPLVVIKDTEVSIV